MCGACASRFNVLWGWGKVCQWLNLNCAKMILFLKSICKLYQKKLNIYKLWQFIFYAYYVYILIRYKYVYNYLWVVIHIYGLMSNKCKQEFILCSSLISKKFLFSSIIMFIFFRASGTSLIFLVSDEWYLIFVFYEFLQIYEVS